MNGGSRLKSEALRQSIFTEIPMEFAIEGTSMEPAIKDGAIVLLKPCDGKTLTPGHSYVFREGTSLILHRYVATHGEFAIFFGDNTLAPQLVPLNNVVGQLCTEEPRSIRRIDRLNRLFFKLFELRRLLIAKIILRRRKSR